MAISVDRQGCLRVHVEVCDWGSHWLGGRWRARDACVSMDAVADSGWNRNASHHSG